LKREIIKDAKSLQAQNYAITFDLVSVAVVAGVSKRDASSAF